MENAFSDRITDVPRSFIREILKVTIDASIISFAGGLPNRLYFPVQGLQQAAHDVFAEAGADALQYANTEGFPGLRQWIADRYRQQEGLDIPIEDILITTGSQQGLDLLGKTFLNEGDDLVIEEPGYLGAIQAFAMYRPRFHPVPVAEGGMDIGALTRVMRGAPPQAALHRDQFPEPLRHQLQRRQPAGRGRAGARHRLPDHPGRPLRRPALHRQPAALRSSASCRRRPCCSARSPRPWRPSLRLGWLVAPPPIMDKLVIAKQAADLHTNALAQRILHRFLTDNDLDAHIATIIRAYGRQKEAMIAAIRDHFPAGVQCTDPEGGMFLWVTLPEGMSSMALFDAAIKKKVAFVPGAPFYVDRKDSNTLRLNFSCSDEPTIVEGIRRLGTSIKELS